MSLGFAPVAGSPLAANRWLTAPAPGVPSLLLTPNLLVFEAIVGGSTPDAELVVISNDGSGSLASPTLGTPTYLQGSDWLALDLAGLSLTVGVVLTGLTAGVYHATVPVESVGADDTPQTLYVALRLIAQTSHGMGRWVAGTPSTARWINGTGRSGPWINTPEPG